MTSFSVNLSYQGKTVPLENVTTNTTGVQFYSMVYNALELSPNESTLKLLLKGKRISSAKDDFVFTKPPPTKSPPKILVMASAKTLVQELNAKKQDPTIRGFDQEKTQASSSTSTTSYWGPLSQPDKNYKFCRLKECPFHDFGHRPTDQTPHAFAARQLLQRLAEDPGVIAILKERQLVVGTLGEMDPIDDRLMQNKQQQGTCLLGYNTNHGLRIDLKLRTDDLSGFRPYGQLAATLIHELSHNWVGEHNLIFWANYGQMRLEYLFGHYKQLSNQLYNGKTSAQWAELPPLAGGQESILAMVVQDLVSEMAQHHLHPNMIEQPLRERFEQLLAVPSGKRLGGGENHGEDKRHLALQAAERRAREQQQKEDGKEHEER
jgi:WLM domain